MTSDQIYQWGRQTIRQGGLPPLIVLVIHIIASRCFHAYDRFPAFDIPMHILGGAAIAYFFHRASSAASEHGIIGPFHRINHAILVFALTCTASVFWEFAEFITDHYFGTHAQLGLNDTLGDMFFGICGGITFLAVNQFANSSRGIINWGLVLAIAAGHFITSVFILVATFVASMSNFDSPSYNPPSHFIRLMGTVTKVLHFPVVTYWPFDTPGLTGYFAFVLNSLLWAVCIYAIGCFVFRLLRISRHNAA